jgi:hypothetical protein
MSSSRRRTFASTSGRSAALVGLGFLVVLGTAAGLVSARSSNESATDRYRQHVGMIAYSHPLAAGKKVADLSSAASSMKTPLFLPAGEGISASNAQVWVRTGEDEYLLVVFESGLQVEIRPWPTRDGTPEDHWSLLRKDGIPGDLERIG